MTEAGVEIVNLRSFQRALRASEAGATRELSRAIRAAGRPIVERARVLAPRRTGLLASAYAIRASGTTGNVINRAPYGAGAEWGLHGKWKGFRRYRGVQGGRGRFAARAVEERRDEIVRIMTDELREIITISGWAG